MKQGSTVREQAEIQRNWQLPNGKLMLPRGRLHSRRLAAPRAFVQRRPVETSEPFGAIFDLGSAGSPIWPGRLVDKKVAKKSLKSVARKKQKPHDDRRSDGVAPLLHFFISQGETAPHCSALAHIIPREEKEVTCSTNLIPKKYGTKQTDDAHRGTLAAPTLLFGAVHPSASHQCPADADDERRVSEWWE